MKCPYCDSERYHATSTVTKPDGTKVQYRKCEDCGKTGKTEVFYYNQEKGVMHMIYAPK